MGGNNLAGEIDCRTFLRDKNMICFIVSCHAMSISETDAILMIDETMMR